MKGIDCWIQIACPRLSIDWGSGYSRPLLTCYEAFVALGEAEWTEQYPMDWYSAEGGPWSNCQNFFVCHKHNQLLYQRKKLIHSRDIMEIFGGSFGIAAKELDWHIICHRDDVIKTAKITSTE